MYRIERDKSEAEREIPARVEQSVLGWWWGRGTRIFSLHGGINEATILQYVRHQGEQETG